MDRRDALLTLAVALLAAVPAFPLAQAQAPAPQPALAVVFGDDFDATDAHGWSVATHNADPAAAKGDAWFHARDGVGDKARTVWYAARPGGGYDTNADVRLNSPVITMPASFMPRSVAITLRGSSEPDADILTLEWASAIDVPDNQWTTLKTWSGTDLATTYTSLETTSANLLTHQGPFVLRLRFVSDTSCDSDPGTPGATVTGTPSTANPGSNLPTVTPPDPMNPPDPTDPNYDPTTMVTPGYDPTGVNPDPGETGDAQACSGNMIGWLVDSVVVIGRRDFTLSAPPGAPHLNVDATGPDLAIDLFADRGKLLDLRVDTGAADYSSVLMHLQRTGSADALDIAATRAGSLWSGLLAVDEPDLITGQWTVSYFGQTPEGSGVLLGTRILSVGAQDAAAPVLTVAPTGDPVRMGPGSLLGLTVLEPFLRRVTFSYPGLPAPADLPFPYLLSEASLPEGPSTVTFTATDRTGHVATSVVHVDRDTLRPVVSMVAPTVVYAGVPFALALKITERSAHSIHLDANGTKLDFEVGAGQATAGRSTDLQLTAPDLGNFTVKVLVNDTVGNQALDVRQFTAVRPVSDLRVSSVRLVTPTTNVQKEGESIVAVVEQVGGVAALPVTVTFDSGSQRVSYTVTVPAVGPKEVRWDAMLLAGTHTVNVHAAGPAILNETNPGNENGSIPVEVFLGRMDVGSHTYVIRADAHGLPSVAMLANTTTTYALKVVDNGRGIAYRFNGVGNQTIDWDPLNPVVSKAGSSSDTSTKAKASPAAGPLIAALVVALAAMAQRRRKA